MALKDSFHLMPPSRRRIVLRRLAAVLVLVLLAGAAVYAFTRDGEKPTQVNLPQVVGNLDSGPESHISFLERLIPPAATAPVKGPAAPRSVADLARRLPLERAVAQLFLFGFTGKDESSPVFDQLKRLDLGGVVVDGRNYDNAQQLAGLTARMTSTAAAAGHVPPWVMAEQDGGDYSQFPDLPPSHPPGDFHSAAGATAALADSATTLKALGINGLLEPALDVGSDTGGVLGTRTFSSDPQKVADYARRSVAACRQLQLFCAAKHFPGIGAADTPTDEGPAQIGLPMAQLEARDVVPFAAAIKAGIPGIVVGEGLYEPDDFVTPAALSSKIIGGLLRKRLRFGGIAITDDVADPGVSSFAQVPDAAVDAIKAGADMVYISGEMSDEEAAYTAVLNATRSGQIPEQRVREALLRVLLTKRGYGLVVGP